MSFVSRLPPEVWSLISDEIQSFRLLAALVLVCRTFRDIFTPFLYARHVIQLDKYQSEDLLKRDLHPRLSHTKSLEVRFEEFSMQGIAYSVVMNDVYASAVARMIEAMPNLRRFSWFDRSFEDEHDPSLMLSNHKLLSALSSCQTLKHLYISFECRVEDDMHAAFKCHIPLSGFRNLISLDLYHFGGTESTELKNIGTVLAASPQLRRLGLGMGWACDVKGIPEIVIIDGNRDFFEQLCLCYRTLEAPPLRLETLRLGHGMFPCDSKSLDAGNYMAGMIDGSNITTLHLFNGWVRPDDEDEDGDELLQVNWELFEGCTSLCQLAITRLDADTGVWLDTQGQLIEELIITDHFSMYDHALKNFDRMRLPNLSMIFTREVTVADEGGWSDSESESDSENETESESSISTSKPVPLGPVVTVLHRLYDHGVNLQSLGLCLDFETQWENFATHLPNLTRLTQVRLSSKSMRKGRYPKPESSLWPEVNRPKEIAARYAQLLKSMCPSLQYVEIGYWVWHATTDPNFSTSGDTNIYSEIHLRQLEFDEFMSFDLFYMDSFAGEAGLPQPETYIEETTQEEDDWFDKTIADVELAMRRAELLIR